MLDGAQRHWPDGAMKLIPYMHKNRLTYRGLAKMLDRDPATVWRWAAGTRQPSLADALAIEAATQGSVTCADLAEDAAK